jgi:steroid delta-isomerase-like uncharacterized protein
MTTTQRQLEEADRNKEVVRRAYDAINSGAIDKFGNLLADDFKEIDQRGETKNKTECIAETKELKRAFPDLRYDLQEVIAEGDKVAVVDTFSGTMKGEMSGMQPTGKRMSVPEVDVYRVKNGKLAEVHSALDTGFMMEQLGVLR